MLAVRRFTFDDSTSPGAVVLKSSFFGRRIPPALNIDEGDIADNLEQPAGAAPPPDDVMDRSRARSLPLEDRHTVVCCGTQTSLLSGLSRLKAATDDVPSCSAGGDDWLRRIEAMDLSFPVNSTGRCSELRGYLTETLGFATLAAGGVEAIQKAVVQRPSMAAAVAGGLLKTPTMAKRWTGCNLTDAAAHEEHDGPRTFDFDELDSSSDDSDDDEADDLLVDESDRATFRRFLGLPTKRANAAGTDRLTVSNFAGDVVDASSFQYRGGRITCRLPSPKMPIIHEDDVDEEDEEDEVEEVDERTRAALDESPPPPLPPRIRSVSSPPPSVRSISPDPLDVVVEDDAASAVYSSTETMTYVDDGQSIGSNSGSIVAVPPSSPGCSLLDLMHKKYCAHQYIRSPAAVTDRRRTAFRLDQPPVNRHHPPNSPSIFGGIGPVGVSNLRRPGDVPCCVSPPPACIVKDHTSKIRIFRIDANGNESEERCSDDDGDSSGGSPVWIERTGVDGTLSQDCSRDSVLTRSIISSLYSEQSFDVDEHGVDGGDTEELDVEEVEREQEPIGWRRYCEECGEDVEMSDDDELPSFHFFRLGACQAELEAIEACEWLREAGFPQYSQMYRDQRFPLDLEGVRRDHNFLGDDALEALFRRLRTLEKCTNMKLKTTNAKTVADEESDEDDLCALSDRWTYQRHSHQWSRMNSFTIAPSETSEAEAAAAGGTGVGPDTAGGTGGVSSDGSLHSTASCDSAIETTPYSTSTVEASHGNSPKLLNKFSSAVPASAFVSAAFPCPSTFDQMSTDCSPHADSQPPTPKDFVVGGSCSQQQQTSLAATAAAASSDSERSSSGSASVSPGLRRAAGERLRGAWSSLLKKGRRGTSSSSSSSSRGRTPPESIEISSPTLVDLPGMRAKMDALRCVDLSPSAAGYGDLDSTSTTPSGYRMLPCPRQASTPTSPLTVHELAAALRTASASSSTTASPQSNSSSLWTRRRQQQPPVLEQLDNSGRPRRLQLSAEQSATVPRGGGSAASAVRRSVYDNVDSPPSTSVAADPQSELDAILTALYRDISMLSCSLAVVKEEHTDAEKSLCGDEDDSASASHTPTINADDSDSNCHVVGSTSDPRHSLNPAVMVAGDHGSRPGPIPRRPTANGSASDRESIDSTSEQREDDWTYPDGDLHHQRERRDSGVGSSLTRSARRQNRAHRIRWHSFAKSHRPNITSRDDQMSSMSAGQLVVLHRLCMLRVTAMLEKHSPAHRSGRSWFVPRLMKRAKTPDYSDRNVFAVPLNVIQQRHGQPLPQCILYAMRRLRRSAAESIGIFRKSGVRSRIIALRNDLEADADSLDFDSLSAYDVADLLKLYFRELPDCLLTSKLSHVFISIFQYIPEDERMDLLKAAILLLPDGHRETLQSLLLFLSDMAKHAEHNQMNARNLAVCFAPSLFHLCGRWKSSGSEPSSSRRSTSSRRSRSQTGIPSEKDLAEQRASHECLTCMITNSRDLFTLPKQTIERCHLSYMEQGDPVTLEELVSRHGRGDVTDHTAYVDTCIQGLLKESRDKFKGWVSVSSCGPDVDLAYKKVGDGHPLRLWKFSVDVEAPPIEVLERVLRERHLWDDDVIKWRVVERLDVNTEVFQYVVNAMVPHPTRDFCELRSWRCDLPNSICVLVSTSVEHRDAPLMGGIRAVTLASRYLVEPCGSGRSRLTHISRVDLRGRTPEWYNTVYGHLFTNYARRIRSSFQSNASVSNVPETNV